MMFANKRQNCIGHPFIPLFNYAPVTCALVGKLEFKGRLADAELSSGHFILREEIALSIKTMSRVWDYSMESGSRLLLMLAIADYAHDDGAGANPSTRTLARKTRMTQQNVLKLIDRCEADGELKVARGRNRETNQYTIILPSETAKKFLAQNLANSRAKQAGGSPLMKSLAKPKQPPEPKNGSVGSGQTPAPKSGAPHSQQQNVYEALVRVCLLPEALLRRSDNDGVRKMKAQVGKVASTLVDLGYSGQQVLTSYSRDGWWWKEYWQGKDKQETPTLGGILKTIGEAVAHSNGSGSAWEDPQFTPGDRELEQRRKAAAEEFEQLRSKAQ